ncbi:MAG: glycine betaine/L-proline ABC transporter substrate-binding protein ProX [Caldilineaceae bacterium]|nr:glycine betaine/L-proline ABC transporter substrate-binding protein ProX [Caldilineaceae bacterium]
MQTVRRFSIFSLLLVAALLLAACPATTPAAPGAESTTPAGEALPGTGQTLEVALPTWDTGWFSNWVVFRLAEELGYEIDEPSVLENPAFYTSVAQGDIDFWSSGWLPLHNTFIEPVADRVEVAGTLVPAGALQGYLIDKATADEYGITSLEDLKDPEIAALFDSDGDGLANLIGCNPGWGCELVIEHHLDVYGLRDYIEHDQGTYSALMADALARYQTGESIFFYTWTPNWTIVELVPGEDVVWIEVPFPSLPENQAQFEDATQIAGVTGCVNDPCEMGFPGNDIDIIANTEWLDQNPALAALFAQVQIPLQDIARENELIVNGEDSEEDIMRHADEWIANNRDLVDSWLDTAMAAATTAAASQ